jgi:hypothetical protein
MDTEEKPARQHLSDAEEPWIVEGTEEKQSEPEPREDAKTQAKEMQERRQEPNMLYFGSNSEADRKVFVNGLSVGVGIGCIATFVIMWVAVFFSPQLPQGATYENLLSIFIYPLIYLLAVGLIALTAGIVREYYAAKFKP